MLGQSGNGEFALGQIEDHALVLSVAGRAFFAVFRTGRVSVKIRVNTIAVFAPQLTALTDVTIRDAVGMRVEIE